MNGDNNDIVQGSGNVFADFGYHDSDVMQAKSVLAARIIGVLEERRLSVRNAQALTGVAAADFSRIRHADYGRFTLDRLIRILNALDNSVEVTLHLEARGDASLTEPRPDA